MAHRNRIECYICNTRLIPRVMVRLGGVDNNILRQEIAINRRDQAGRPPIPIADESRICNNCNITILREIRMLQDDPQCMRLNVLSQTSSRSCLICNAENEIHRLTVRCRIDIFIKRNIYVPENHLCCNDHLDENGLLFNDLCQQLRFINRPYIIRGHQVQIILQGFREEVLSSRNSRFENENCFTEDEFTAISPINRQQFADLFTYCDRVPDILRRLTKKDLLCFLCKLKQGLSDEFLCLIFNYSSRRTVSHVISTVRQSLMIRFVPENIGYQAITRQQYIDRHVTDFSNKLYNTQPENRIAIVYNDCSYLDIEKSSCFQVLRQSYCLHKNKHLVKPSMMVAPDGYILNIQGPYFSNAANNDAAIILNELQRDLNGIQDWFEEGDMFIVDRGYRDAVVALEAMGFVVRMPPLLHRGQRQFTTEQGNESRLITKTRWVVEARNGHMKSIFKFFAQMIRAAHVIHLNDFLLICGAIINRYHPSIVMEGADVAAAELMRERAQEPNVVQARVEVENLTLRRARWVPFTPQRVPLFPQLTLDDLRRLTFGTYQVYLSPSYIQDLHLRADLIEENEVDNVLEIDERTDEPGFIRVRVFSRFRNALRYQLWISFDEEYVVGNRMNDFPILGYYCTCKAGARTLGTCAHLASVLWYLGFARHEDNVRYPSMRLLQSVLNARNDIEPENQ